jgi:NagD protein
MVGDTMDTDILGGLGMGYRTVLVLSGHTQLVDLSHYAYRPDYVVESVDHLPKELLWPEIALEGAA